MLVGSVGAIWLFSKVANSKEPKVGAVRPFKPTEAVDVPWLSEVQQPPSPIAQTQLRLTPLESGKALIRTRPEWEAERQRLRKRWFDFLGPMPAKRPPVHMNVLLEDKLEDGCVRQLVQYNGELNQQVEGYFLRPPATTPSTKRAGIVAFHPTAGEHIHEIAGVRGRPNRDVAVQLAKRGFVVFCPKCFLWENPQSFTEAAQEFKKRRPATLGMHKMLWDGMRAVDVLQADSQVDASRIGAVGHSLGAKETLYLAAFDERIKAAVASEGGIGLNFTNWDAPWYLGEGIHDKEFDLNHSQLLALTAPRSFLVLAGESGEGAADGDRTWPYIEAAMPVYRLYRPQAPLGLYNHRQGHSLPPAAFERMVEWLKTYLQA